MKTKKPLPRCYYLRTRELPDLDKLKALGADISLKRGDVFHIEEISEILLQALNNHFR